MRRSQEKSSFGPSPTKEKKKLTLEQTYGVTIPKPKPAAKGSGNVLKKSTAVTGISNARPKQSSIVAAFKASHAEKYGLQPQKRQTVSEPHIKAKSINARKAMVSSQSLKSTAMSSSSLKQGKTIAKNVPIAKVPKEEIDYEDDFEEDYQSDFEEVESTGSEDNDFDESLCTNAELALAAEETFRESPQDLIINKKLPDEPRQNSNTNTSLTETENNVAEFERLEKQVEENEDESGGDTSEETSVGYTNNINNNQQASQTAYPGSDFFSKSNQNDAVSLNNVSNRHPNGQQRQTRVISGLGRNLSGDSSSTTKNLQKNFSTVKEVKNSRDVAGVEVSVVSSPSKHQILRGPTTPAFDFKHCNEELYKKVLNDRGRRLKEMIRLNEVFADLLHLDPSVEQFLFASSGTCRLQRYAQAEIEKNQVSVQTEDLDFCTKWTQKPPTWSTRNHNLDLKTIREEAIGVGTEESPNSGLPKQVEQQQFDFLKNWQKLSNFIGRASRKILYVLESEKRLSLPTNDKKSGAEIKMNRGLSILNKLEMGCLTCEGDFVACANGQSEHNKGRKKHTSKTIITVWSMKEPSNPIYFLRAWGLVSIIKIYPLGHLVLSGNKEGTISIWDLDEAGQYHTQYQESIIRTPSVTTSCMDTTHFDTIVGLAVIPEATDTSLILSVDKSGLFLIWICTRTKEPVADINYTQYSSAWSKIHLTIRYNSQLNEILKEPLSITALQGWKEEECMEFAISTMNGFTAQGLFTGDKIVCQKYAESQNHDPSVVCFDLSTDIHILLTGCRDERCRLYDFKKRKMILSVNCKAVPVSVKWSKRRSSIFYVALPTFILIWDLLVSDVAPIKNVPVVNIQGFEIYSTPQMEFTVVMASNELKISSCAGDLKPLTSKDKSRLQSFFALLVAT